jgi:hypothetical protein
MAASSCLESLYTVLGVNKGELAGEVAVDLISFKFDYNYYIRVSYIDIYSQGYF